MTDEHVTIWQQYARHGKDVVDWFVAMYQQQEQDKQKQEVASKETGQKSKKAQKTHETPESQATPIFANRRNSDQFYNPAKASSSTPAQAASSSEPPLFQPPVLPK